MITLGKKSRDGLNYDKIGEKKDVFDPSSTSIKRTKGVRRKSARWRGSSKKGNAACKLQENALMIISLTQGASQSRERVSLKEKKGKDPSRRINSKGGRAARPACYAGEKGKKNCPLLRPSKKRRQ